MKQATLTRRRLLKAMAAGMALGAFPPWAGVGQSPVGGCPQVAGRTIRWIVPFGVGGGFDVYSRLIEPFYERTLGAQIVIENLPGASGIVGTTALVQAPPDGLTQGIVNGAALLSTVLRNEENAINPVTEMSVLGRVARSQQVWVTSTSSPLRTLEDVLDEAQRRPLVVGVSGVTATSFVSFALTAHLLNVDLAYVTGYDGSAQESLAAIRGETDLASDSFETFQDRIEADELRPLIQISDTPIKDHPALEGVPTLGGPDGVAAALAPSRGVDVAEALDDATGVSELIGGGRLIAGPPRLPPETFDCLEQALYDTLIDPEFQAAAAAAARTLDVARSDQAIADLITAMRKLDDFKPILERESAKANP